MAMLEKNVLHFYHVECLSWIGWIQPDVCVSTYDEALDMFNNQIKTMDDWLPEGVTGDVVRIWDWKSDRKPKRCIIKKYNNTNEDGQSDLFGG